LSYPTAFDLSSDIVYACAMKFAGEPMNTAQFDQAIHDLCECKDAWARLPIPQKIDLLLQLRANLSQVASWWVDVSVESKRIERSSPWVGEEWLSGPWASVKHLPGIFAAALWG
jgi:aldehyde dehydrogenase (NAD(P)+)